jgi:hypothetical protein
MELKNIIKIVHGRKQTEIIRQKYSKTEMLEK